MFLDFVARASEQLTRVVAKYTRGIPLFLCDLERRTSITTNLGWECGGTAPAASRLIGGVITSRRLSASFFPVLCLYPIFRNHPISFVLGYMVLYITLLLLPHLLLLDYINS